MRNIIKNYLVGFGREYHFEARVHEAENGREAVIALGSNNVDIVFLDWNMPGYSGVDFLRTIRTMEQYKNLPVVMVTSEMSKENIITAFKEGAREYIIKPIDDDIFKKKIIAILEKI
jgi:CheY-like chemotaxis protein